MVDDGRGRRMQRRAQRLGFDNLRSYLQACCDTGVSIPALAEELGVSDWMVKQALDAQGVLLPRRPERLARQRQRFSNERIAGRVAELGFADVRAYLADRLVTRAWLLADVAAELGAHRVTVRRLMDQHGIRRTRRTARELAAGERGRWVQSVSWQARRAARLAELGFGDLAAYLQRRHVGQGWSVKRMRAELRVGRRWLVAEMARLGFWDRFGLAVDSATGPFDSPSGRS